MKRYFAAFALALLLTGFQSLLTGQVATLDVAPNRFTPASIFGQGARAMGMGGAFIATADDATAASWNPAGLGQQVDQPQFSLVWGYLDQDLKTHQTGTFATYNTIYNSDPYWSYTRDVDSTYSSSEQSIQFLAISTPIRLGGLRLVTQFSYNRLFEPYRGISQKKSWDRNFLGNNVNLQEGKLTSTDVYEPYGANENYGLSIATKINEKLWIGGTLNYIHQERENVYQNHTSGYSTSGGVTSPIENSSYLVTQTKFSGFTWDLGVLVQPLEYLRLGGVYHSRNLNEDFDFSYNASTTESSTEQYTRTVGSNQDLQGTMDWPQGVGIGLSVKPFYPITNSALKHLSIVFDYSHFWWDSGIGNVTLPPEDASFIQGMFNTGINTTTGSDLVSYLNISPTKNHHFNYDTYRLGAEYNLFPTDDPGLVVPLRAGYFLENQTGSTWEFIHQQPTFKGFTLGGGVRWGWFQLDFAMIFSRESDSAVGGNDEGFYYIPLFIGNENFDFTYKATDLEGNSKYDSFRFVSSINILLEDLYKSFKHD